MNIYAIIILAAIILDFAIEAAGDYLNLKHLSKELPPGWEGVYTPEQYEKSQRYLKERTIFSYYESVPQLMLILAFWFLGGFAWLDELVGFAASGEITRGLLYIGLIAAGLSIFGLPYDIWSAFVIEKKYGFNKMTGKTFFLDKIKTMLLGAALGGPLLAGLLWALRNAGSYAWLYGWAGVTAVSLAMQYIAPKYIMPIFNKFTPIGDGELKDAIFALARRAEFPLKNVFVMDGSRRSTKSNAFFSGFGRNKMITLFDTLIARHTTAELTAVLAHEIGHYRKKHVQKGMMIGIVHTGLVFALLQAFMSVPELYRAFHLSYMPLYCGLVFFSFLYSPAEMIISVLANMISRRHEFEADRYAAELTSPADICSALKRLSSDNLSNLTPHPFYVFVNYSHPPVIERIRAINKAGGKADAW